MNGRLFLAAVALQVALASCRRGDGAAPAAPEPQAPANEVWLSPEQVGEARLVLATVRAQPM